MNYEFWHQDSSEKITNNIVLYIVDCASNNENEKFCFFMDRLIAPRTYVKCFSVE